MACQSGNTVQSNNISHTAILITGENESLGSNTITQCQRCLCTRYILQSVFVGMETINKRQKYFAAEYWNLYSIRTICYHCYYYCYCYYYWTTHLCPSSHINSSISFEQFIASAKLLRNTNKWTSYRINYNNSISHCEKRWMSTNNISNLKRS